MGRKVFRASGSAASGVEVLVEAVVQTQEISGFVLYGLSLRNGTVEWVTSPLDLDEAEPGTRWARVGGRAYVASSRLASPGLVRKGLGIQPNGFVQWPGGQPGH